MSSELSLELAPTCAAVIAAHPDTPVVGTAMPVGPKSTTGLGGQRVGLAAMMATGDPRLDGDAHVLPQGS